MQALTENVTIPSNINLIAVGSYQNKPPTIFQMMESQYLDPLFALATLFSSTATDGIVPVKSATTYSSHVPVRTPAIVGHLDHAEQVLDYRILAAFGETNVDYVRDQQTLLYSEIINSLQ